MVLDIASAYDSVNRKKLFKFLDSRIKSKEDEQIVNLIKSLYTNQKISIGDH